MALPKIINLEDRNLPVLRVVYAIAFAVIFFPLSVLWILVLPTTLPVMGDLLSLNSLVVGIPPIILLLCIFLGGNALFTVFNISIFALKRQMARSQLSRYDYLSLSLGCLVSLYLSFASHMHLMVLPIIMVAYLFLILELNQSELEALEANAKNETTPTSQNHPPQEQV